MKIDFTFRQMESSEGLKGHTASKLERLSRFEEQEMVVHVTFGIEKFNKCVELQVNGATGYGRSGNATAFRFTPNWRRSLTRLPRNWAPSDYPQTTDRAGPSDSSSCAIPTIRRN